MDSPKNDHFEGKDVFEHLMEARLKGKKASQEPHGLGVSQPFFCFFDAIKSVSALLIILLIIGMSLFPSTVSTGMVLLLFSLGYIFWTLLRTFLLSWRRLEKMHKLIEQEKWEIEHHRETEKEELRAIYQAKGFQGKRLEDVVNVLMADDNRLLETMLTEELGLTLEVMEHPLKLAVVSFVGALVGAAVNVAAFYFSPYALYVTGIVFIGASSIVLSKQEKVDPIYAFFWNVASIALVAAVVYFSKNFFTGFF